MGLFGPGGIVSTGIGVGLDMITGGGYGNQQSAQQTNASQMQLANDQMQFQERMSSTAYQRAMADMQKAGLNPMLAYQNGGASAPSGAMADLKDPHKGDVGKGARDTALMVASGLADFKQKKSQADLNNENIPVAKATAEKTTANAKESQVNAELATQQKMKAAEDTRDSKARAKISEMEAEKKAARFESDIKLAPYEPYIEKLGQASGVIGRAMPKLNINVGDRRPDPVTDYDGWLKDYKKSPKGKRK